MKGNSMKAYFVEVDNSGCEKCNSGRTYRVVNELSQMMLPTTYESKEDADELCRRLNSAHAEGAQARK